MSFIMGVVIKDAKNSINYSSIDDFYLNYFINSMTTAVLIKDNENDMIKYLLEGMQALLEEQRNTIAVNLKKLNRLQETYAKSEDKEKGKEKEGPSPERPELHSAPVDGTKVKEARISTSSAPTQDSGQGSYFHSRIPFFFSRKDQDDKPSLSSPSSSSSLSSSSSPVAPNPTKRG